MEKVETFRQEIPLPGKEKTVSFIRNEWRFTKTEKHEIHRTLKNEASKEDIKAFICHLEFFANRKKESLGQTPKADVRATRERVLTDCKAALSHLKQIERGRLITARREKLDGIGNVKAVDPFVDFLRAQFQSAWEAAGPLEKFIKTFEKYHLAEIKKTGRSSADSDNFIKKIRDIYIQYIGKPTAYEQGAFFSVVQIILEYIGLPYTDPSRAIKAALKSK